MYLKHLIHNTSWTAFWLILKTKTLSVIQYLLNLKLTQGMLTHYDIILYQFNSIKFNLINSVQYYLCYAFYNKKCL